MAGYVDIHCHGGGGHTFGDSVAGTLAAFAAHKAHGTVGLVASLVSMPVNQLERAVAVVREAMAAEPGILGIHLEGPFLSPDRRGAHDPAALAVPTERLIAQILGIVGNDLRQVTIAPELPGALEAVRAFREAGAVVAVGHTTADAERTAAAFDAGASLITHAFNAMSGIEGREIGPVGAAVANPNVTIEVIADGIHLSPTVIRTVFAAAPGRVALVTDAMGAAGAGPGRYALGGLDVDVADGRAVIAGTETLAGSTLTMDRAVAVCIEAGVAPAEAQAAASSTPARVLAT